MYHMYLFLLINVNNMSGYNFQVSVSLSRLVPLWSTTCLFTSLKDELGLVRHGIMT